VEPFSDPALEALGEFLAEALNALYPSMVRRWIASELPSFRIEEYPLLQLQCLEREGENLERCKGSIRYLLPNTQLQVGPHQQSVLPYVARAIARAICRFEQFTLACASPCQIVGTVNLRAETRTGPLLLAEGNQIQLTWIEVFFDYRDHSQLI
jgi:hypothetical protein